MEGKPIKFVIRTENQNLHTLLLAEIDKMLKKKFKKEMKEGKAILSIGENTIEIIAMDRKLQEEFKKSFKKNMGFTAKMLQKKGISKLFGNFSMDLVPCE